MKNRLPLIRVGHGYDLHRLVVGRKLILGGIEIPHNKGLLGHSDGDCLIHALSDSLLGALGLPDIGCLFPDTKAEFKDMDSMIILKKAQHACITNQYKISNLDLTIVAQEPKINPYIETIREKLSKFLQLEGNQVGIKATTNEGLGPIGKKEAIACFAICSLELDTKN
tara:strand:- start:4302 stop:4805 length:504 start_codon:yes stop_codon:yes gene_type:complete